MFNQRLFFFQYKVAIDTSTGTPSTTGMLNINFKARNAKHAMRKLRMYIRKNAYPDVHRLDKM